MGNGGDVRYALLICQDETVITGTEPRRVAAYEDFEERARARGALVGAQRLRPTTTATTVQVRAGDIVIADGPFAETKEQIAGFYLVECEDLDDAISLAAEIPSAQWGTIEVRPLWDP
jgi:hypothetical protein